MPYHFTLPAHDVRLATQQDLESSTLVMNRRVDEHERVVRTLSSSISSLTTALAESNRIIEALRRDVEALRTAATRTPQIISTNWVSTAGNVVPAGFVQPATIPHTPTPAPERAVASDPQPASGSVQQPSEPAAVQGVPDRPVAAGVDEVAAPTPSPAPAPVPAVELPTLVSALRSHSTTFGLDNTRRVMAGLGFASASATPADRRHEVIAALAAAAALATPPTPVIVPVAG